MRLLQGSSKLANIATAVGAAALMLLAAQEYRSWRHVRGLERHTDTLTGDIRLLKELDRLRNNDVKALREAIRAEVGVHLRDQLHGNTRHLEALSDQINQTLPLAQQVSGIIRHLEVLASELAVAKRALSAETARQIAIVLRVTQELRVAINDAAERHQKLNARILLSARSRRVASKVDVREIRTRLDVAENTLRQNQVKIAEIVAALEASQSKDARDKN